MEDTRFLESYGEIFKTKCLQDEPPFCRVACPFHLDIADMITKWSAGRVSAVYRGYQTAVGFPEIVSRICSRPCENSCILKHVGGAVQMGALEAATLKQTRRKSPNAFNMPAKPQTAAVVGGGLSGLGCALKLCQKKYRVTLFEASDHLGGAARELMDPEIFDEDIKNQFQFEEPDIRLNTRISDIAVLKREYDAVYVATGAGGDDFGLKQDSGGAFASNMPGVFLGGALTGADPVTALAQGLRASMALERYIKIQLMNEPFPVKDTGLVMDPAHLAHTEPVTAEDPENGFTKDEVVREAKRCIRCSCDICMRECDLMRIQKKTPGRLYEESYITVRPSTLANDGRWATRRIASCDQCGLCKDVCPERIDMGDFLWQSHRGLKETDAMPWAFHDYWLRDMENAAGPGALTEMPAGQCDYAFFPGCQLGASDPSYVTEALDWLRSHKPDTALFLNCCGAPAHWAVEREKHTEHLQKLRGEWERLGKPKLVFACPTCRKMFRQFLPEIPGVFIEELMLAWGLPEGAGECAAGKRFALFDPCASRQEPELQENVRKILEKAGICFAEIPGNGKYANCCSYGGQYSIAAPDYAKRVIQERTAASDLPYLCYCANCRDTFAGQDKDAVHLFDILFGIGDEKRPAPTVTARRKNRMILADALTGTERKEEVKLIVSQELEQRLSDMHILISDMEEVVESLEAEGRGIVSKETGYVTGHKKIQNMTYWAVYEPVPGGIPILHGGYAHRMNLEGE